MDLTVLLFLTSGLFLGWSLGANDAANVFGTAVGTRMVSFGTAALVCGVCVVLGAVISGAGAAHTLGKLGSINALGGSFVAALSAALTVYWMTKASLPGLYQSGHSGSNHRLEYVQWIDHGFCLPDKNFNNLGCLSGIGPV